MHDHRSRVSELEENLLARRALAQLPADVGGAREGDRAHPLVLDEHVADLARGPDEDVEPAGRKTCLVRELRERQRRERSLARRLEDDRAARGEGRSDLVGDEVEREVERADRADDADRLAQRERELALSGLGGVHRHHLAGELAGLDRRERVRRHRPARLDLGGLQGLAGLSGDLGGDLVVPRAIPATTLTRISARLWAGSGSAMAFSAASIAACASSAPAFATRADDLARKGRAHLEPLARLDPLAPDQELPFSHRYAHDGEDTPMKVPDVSYARSGDVSIAYQVVGDGPTDLVFLPFLSNLYTLWQFPRFATILRRLAEGRRLIVVNLRGVGLSDRPRGFTIESRMDDLRAVLDTEGSERPALIGLAEAAATCAVFAASNPDRVERLILYDPWARGVRDEEERDEALAQIREGREQWGRRDVLEEMAIELNPQWTDDEEYLEWFVWHHRLTSSPAAWAEFRRMQIDLDVTDVLQAIRVPTIVIGKERTRENATEVAAGIPGAELVIVPGIGRGIFENDFAVEAIETFLAGAEQRFIPETVLATVLFTDLVGSTERAAQTRRPCLAGSRRPSTTRSSGGSSPAFAVSRWTPPATGSSRDSTGRRARFAAARRSSMEFAASASMSGSGVHAGECELHEEKVAGIAVSVGARVAGLAGPGQVLVSSTVRDLVAGSGLDFVEHGTHELKGVPGEPGASTPSRRLASWDTSAWRSRTSSTPVAAMSRSPTRSSGMGRTTSCSCGR